MKCVGVAVFVVFLLGGEAFFQDGVFPSNGVDPNTFDITKVLECADDHGERLPLPLVPPGELVERPGEAEVWTPPAAE